MSGADIDVEQLLRLRHLALRMGGVASAPRTNLPGGIVHKRRGRGLEVHDIRPWCEGDDIRHLDRNATARTGQPHVRTFRDERERRVLLVADFRPSMLFGTRRVLRSVAGAEALALLGWRALAQGGRVGLAAATPQGARFVRAGPGTRAMVALIGEMAQAHRAAMADASVADPPLDRVLAEADSVAGAGGALILATALDHPGPDFDAVAARIARKRALVVVLVCDPFEQAPPPGAYPYVGSDGAGWLRIGASRPARPDARIARLHRAGAQVVALDTSLSHETMAQLLEQADG